MKRIKRFVLGLLLTRRERVTIWNALWYSNHTYKRRGNVDAAASVQMVMNRVEDILIPKKKYTDKEVSQIVGEVLEETTKGTEKRLKELAEKEFQRGYLEGKNIAKRILSSKSESGLMPGMIIDREKCEKCEERNECSLYSVLWKGKENSDSSDSEIKDTETKEETKE